MLPDESKEAVKGGIYRGFFDAGQDGHYDAITLMSSQVPFSAHVHQMLMAQNRGPGIDPASDEASNPVGALAESWEISPDGLTVTYTMRQRVKWHPIAPVNGRLMDMDDWKTSQERHLASGVYRNAIGEILSKVEFSGRAPHDLEAERSLRADCRAHLRRQVRVPDPAQGTQR
jgi:hypothetical protein